MSRNRPVGFATGKAGDVYLCHPFLVHAAQKNMGSNVRFMAQPPLLNKVPFKIEGKAEDSFCPVELAIRKGLKINGLLNSLIGALWDKFGLILR